MNSNTTKEIANLFRRFGDYIRSDRVRSLSRTYHQDFTRVFKFPWYDVILYFIFRSEKNTPSELSKYYSSIGKTKLQISRQALFKAAHKLNSNAFIDLIHKFSEMFYQTGLVKTYRDYILLAEDGTTLEIRPTIQGITTYGVDQNQHIPFEYDAPQAISRSSALYDVTNGLIVDFTMKRYNNSEMPLAIGHLERMHHLYDDRKIIYLADRYYGSVELFALLESFKFNYCIRGKSNFFKHYIAKMKTDDEWIKVEIDKAWKKRLKYSFSIERFYNDPWISIRVVKREYNYTDKNGILKSENLIFFTNLSNEEFSTEDIIHLYSKRWDIECSYKTLKSNYEWERYFSADCNIETCSIYAKVLHHNLVGIIRKCLDHELKISKRKDKKYSYHVNISQLNNILQKNNFVRMIRSGNHLAIEKLLDVILGMINKIKVPVRPDRHYPRWGEDKLSSHPHRFTLDGRNYPKVVRIHGRLITQKP